MNNNFNTPPPPSQGRPLPPPRKKTSCARWGCIVAGLALILLVFGILGFRNWYRSYLGPDRVAQLRSLETDVVKLPPEWHQPAPAPIKEVLEFQPRFSAQMDALRQEFETQISDSGTTPDLLTRLQNGDELSATLTESLQNLVTKMGPLIQETSAVAALEGYGLNMDVPTTTSHWLSLREFSKYTAMVALVQARQGDCAAAFDTALVPLRFSRRHPSSPLILHMMAVSETSKAARTVSAIADHCTDTLALRRALDQVTNLREIAVPPDVDLWQYSDNVGALRRAAAIGYPVDLSPQSVVDYQLQAIKLYDLSFDKWIIDNLPADDPRVAVAKRRIATSDNDNDRQATGWQSMVRESPYTRKAVKAITGNDPGAMLVMAARPNIDEFTERAVVAGTLYDLARLHLAQRLAQLEGTSPADAGTTATASTTATQAASAPLPGPEAITRYINPIPLDPATSQPLKFSNEGRFFYGIGPDKKDTGGNPIYDASNGTLSPGDVRIERSPARR